MTLSYSTKWPSSMGDVAGRPNYFIDKIWNGLLRNEIVKSEDILPAYEELYKGQFSSNWDWMDEDNLTAKVHTLREDPSNRWKAGNYIHSVINNRTPNRFQFAPLIPCVSVQKLEIKWRGPDYFSIFIDDKDISIETFENLAVNDGFDSTDRFTQYFNKSCNLKIIHWTDLRY